LTGRDTTRVIYLETIESPAEMPVKPILAGRGQAAENHRKFVREK